MTDEEVLKYFNKWHYVPWDRIDNKYREYLLNRFEDINVYDDEKNTLKESLYRLKNNICEIPKCPICGKKCKSNIYSFGCSCGDKNCSLKIQHITFLKNIHDKYGENISNYAQLDDVKKKIKNTCLQKYGATSPLGNKTIWNLTRQHTIANYGAAYNKEKYNTTLLNKYGVKWFTLHDKLKINSISKEAKDKCFQTQKKNGTINKSKEEDKSYELLRQIFPDCIRNYKDNIRYPFACDFYIPSLDLFIECQYSFFHNKRPYLGDEADLKEIEIIKEKSLKRKQETNKKKSRYDALLDTWTVRDVLKRNTAKQNNLNYLEFFTILELENWLKTYEAESKHYGENNI